MAAIITPFRLYRVLVCPFGISAAPGESQVRIVHQILHEFYLNGVVDIDDTVIYDKYGQFPGKNGSSIGKDGPIQCSSKT